VFWRKCERPRKKRKEERARGKKSEKERLGIPVLMQDILSWNRPGVNIGMAKSGAHSSLMLM
jgi:hypothetical protein